ncbi:MAG: 30S ribosomal protein S6 [Phycisphaerales bacterium]
MPETRTNYYEALFLISQANAATLQETLDHINEILRRAHAEVVALKKWDERRLAFEIDKQKRGVYILAYFSCPASSIDGIHRDVNLSEKVMRCLVIRADHLTIEEMQSADARRSLEDEARLRDMGDDSSAESEDVEEVEA